MAQRLNGYSTARYGKARFFNQTSLPVLSNCSNVNCHFEKTTGNWGSPYLQKANAASDCNYCHNSPPTGNTVSSQGHTAHVIYPQYAGVANCVNCHSNNYAAANPFQHATSVGTPLGMNPGIKYTATVTNYLPSKNATRTITGKCSTASCHNNGNPAPAVNGYNTVAFKIYTTPVFGTPSGCDICHFTAAPSVKPITNAHARHLSFPTITCVACHAPTVNAAGGIGTYANHVNGFVNVSGANIAKQNYITGSHSCTTSYCHSNGRTGAAPITTPQWTDQRTGLCGTCHLATGPTSPINTGAHFAHFTTVYGPKQHSALSTCLECHGATWAETGSTHVNGAITVDNASTAANNCAACHPNGSNATVTTNWAVNGYRVDCNTCHTGTTMSVIGGKTAANKTSILSSLHGKPDAQATPKPMTCIRCHNNTAPHIGNAIANMRLLNTSASPVAVCNDCHGVTSTVVRPAFRGMSTHFTDRGVNNMACNVCHDPHGTTNLSMIRTQLKGAWANATTYTITFTNSTGLIKSDPAHPNRGLCQVCHTKTKFYLAGKPENNHPTEGCLSCHDHKAAGGAFKPAGTCDGCHGYPPMPRFYTAQGTDFGAGATTYVNGRFEDYSGGGGAHYISAHVKLSAKASEGWANCAVCHNGGVTGSTPNHVMKTPIKTNIANVTVSLDQKLRFNNTLQAQYSGAKLILPPNNRTGYCSNVECHFQASPRWSKNK